MDSRRLSARLKQPGDDRTFLASEANFARALRGFLPADRYEIREKPTDLRAIFAGDPGTRALGVEPEASLRNKATGRVMYFEVKKQGPAGNAEERAMKHHTVQFYKVLAQVTGMPYHAYCTIFCDHLASLPRYTTKFKYLIEPGHYFLWRDYDVQALQHFIEREICAKLLDVT